MDAESERSFSARTWWLLIGGGVVFVVLFSLLESLVRPEPTPAVEGPKPVGEHSDVAPSPKPPKLRWADDGAIEIRQGIFSQSRIRLDNEDAEKALFDCLAQGIEQTFGDGTEGWTRKRVKRETQRIQDECMASLLDMPELPRPPQPPLPGN